MEDVLDEVVSSEDLKVGENCLFSGVFDIVSMNVYYSLRYKILCGNCALRNISSLEFSFITSPEVQKQPIEDLEVLIYPTIPVSENTLFFGRFIVLARLSFREEQRVGENEDGTLVE
jgi:hypothetical protein